jgi:hypothetical protein
VHNRLIHFFKGNVSLDSRKSERYEESK